MYKIISNQHEILNDASSHLINGLLSDFHVYAKEIKRCLESNDNHKISIQCDLINAPTESGKSNQAGSELSFSEYFENYREEERKQEQEKKAHSY